MKSQTIITTLIVLALIAYWVVSSRSAKKNKQRRAVGWSWLAIPMVGLLFFANLLSFGQTPMIDANPFVTGVGTALEVAGVALAVWGRARLGVNWSSAAAVKEGHALVVSGPYRVVRHPIYAGFLWGAAGAVLTRGAAWLIIFLVLFVVFVYRMKIEEELMLQEFPQDYPKYQRRTKRLIPFVW